MYYFYKNILISNKNFERCVGITIFSLENDFFFKVILNLLRLQGKKVDLILSVIYIEKNN